ncbi:inositol 1,4,5-triphosphate receptor associated 2-like isoform X1 [Varanus komodoensis]|uniref:inositol 1,4,5-triphosphate receptor associated 2-like isoform X1 n=2 Tax=Varanus komodoensis TaxID=61221 RepID=UPI001CF76BF2|nr:inositol 1,4,5-triphosphate receptor associated 2-like isoform X1 [Varanus komodoensis]XP_044307062.1 inositol 1,4,5-triphosphate receptor associated 2-like isoform X1 [Varanus komodoensis]
MENGVVLQSKEMPVQHPVELGRPVLSLDAGMVASLERSSERMVDERRQSSESINRPCAMRPQEQAKKDKSGNKEHAVRFEESGESDEETDTSEDSLSTSMMELSVLQRLGLHRVALTEQDVEAAFAHLALAFRCDMFTLRRRVQVEERARNTSEENIQQELEQCRTTLQKLDQACVDAKHKDLLEDLQNSLTVLEAAIERANAAAEKLGAVHQEARMSRATEVMVQHVENLKRHHLREHTELEEMKRLIQQNSRNRQLAENRDDGDQRLKHPPLRMFQQGSARRRVSIAVIPKQLTFHSPESGHGSEGEAVKPTVVEEESPERQSHCAPEDSADNYFLLHTGASNVSRRSLQRTNSAECETDGSHCIDGKESELRSRCSISKTVKEEPKEEPGNEEVNKEYEELQEDVLLFKRSNMEFCRTWFSMPTYYWALLWLFFFGIACLVLIRILELQKQYPFTTSDS